LFFFFVLTTTLVPAYVVAVYQLHKQFIPPWFWANDQYHQPSSSTASPNDEGTGIHLSSRIATSHHDDLLRPMADEATMFANKKGIAWEVEDAGIRVSSSISSSHHDELLRPMAQEATAFANKRGVDYGMFVVNNEQVAAAPSRNCVNERPIDYGVGDVTPPYQDDPTLLRPMADDAAQFAHKRGVDYDIFVSSASTTTTPKKDNGPALDYGVWVVAPPFQEDDSLLRPMAEQAKDLTHKKGGADFGIYTNSASQSFSTVLQAYDDATSGCNSGTGERPKDDFPPTPGQTAVHPYTKSFTPYMAIEFDTMVQKTMSATTESHHDVQQQHLPLPEQEMASYNPVPRPATNGSAQVEAFQEPQSPQSAKEGAYYVQK
jgi:hypothetical protein